MPRRRQVDEQLVQLLASGTSIEGTAELAGVHRTTVFRRLQDGDFRQRITACRAAMLERAFGDLSKGAIDASRTIRSLLLSGDEKVRLRASALLLELGLKIREATAVEERLAALEEKIQGRK